MKNIVIDARMINHSGIGTYLRSVLDALTSEFNLTLLGNKNLFKPFPRFEDLKIITCKSKIYSIAEQLELPRKIPRCDLFLSPHYNIPLLPIKAKQRIVIIHDVYHLAYLKDLLVHQKVYAKLMINSAVRLSGQVITVSAFSKSEIVKYTGISEQRIHIIYFGMDISENEKSIDEKSTNFVKQKYLLPDKYFLYVGNIKPHKNLKNLLFAFKTVVSNFPDIKLVIVGKIDGLITKDNESMNLIENDETLQKTVLFTNFVESSELKSIYNLSLGLIFPSFYEGSGLPPVEAMTYGCPVIASSSASIPEVCGDAALYFDPNNVNELADKIELIINNKILRLELIKKGKENIRRFSRETFKQKLISEINDAFRIKSIE